MKKNLLVTLADKNYVEQAKQLFSSAYFNAGWKGDYMLLSYNIPEKDLKWFREKGILVKKVRPERSFKFKREWVKVIPSKKNNIPINAQRNHILHVWYTTSCKFFLFTTYFKKWKGVIYLDGDIIVKGSLDYLTKVKGFAACLDCHCPKLIQRFIFKKRIVYMGNNIITIGRNRINDKLIFKFKKNYNTKKPAFNSGVMAFNTDIISDRTFSRIKNLFDSYGKISFRGFYEEGLFNLLFYKKWVSLPIVYNIYAHYLSRILKIEPEKLKAINLHFVMKKPWNSKNKKDYFYKEWKYNLDRAYLINFTKPQTPTKWSYLEIKKYSLYLITRCFLYYHKDSLYPRTYLNYINKKIGLFGIFLKKKSPKTYYFLKKIKNHND